MPETLDLLAMQRAFLAALREPLLGEGRLATALPARPGEPSRGFLATATRYMATSRTTGTAEQAGAAHDGPCLQPAERLDLYHRQYWYRVLDSLEEDFPALKSLLGDDRFRTLMEDYLEATPSRSATLRHLGSQLASYLAASPHLAGRHAVAAHELAQLEYALCLAFEAGEREPASREQLERGILTLQPHVQPFALRTGADLLWKHATGGGAAPGLPAPMAAPQRFVVVYRDGFEPTMEAVDARAFRLLSVLHEGSTLADAIERSGLADDAAPARGGRTESRSPASPTDDPDPDAAASAGEEDAAALITRWFATWTSRGWLVPHT